MASSEREPIIGVWRRSPQHGPGAEALFLKLQVILPICVQKRGQRRFKCTQYVYIIDDHLVVLVNGGGRPVRPYLDPPLEVMGQSPNRQKCMAHRSYRLLDFTPRNTKISSTQSSHETPFSTQNASETIEHPGSPWTFLGAKAFSRSSS